MDDPWYDHPGLHAPVWLRVMHPSGWESAPSALGPPLRMLAHFAALDPDGDDVVPPFVPEEPWRKDLRERMDDALMIGMIGGLGSACVGTGPSSVLPPFGRIFKR